MAFLLFVLAAFVAIQTVFATQVHQLAFPFVRTIAFARLDPIVTPNQVSGHVHKFLGASRVSDHATFDSLQESECTTHPITADLSSYWMPAFYHVSKDGYKLLDSGDNIIYYSTEAPPDGSGVQAFPDNFKMVSGSPSQTCEEGPDRYFVCIKDRDVYHSVTIPHRECDMIGGHITFPSCWSGNDFTLETQANELVMPLSGALAADCPKTHPIKLPGLMMDLWANATGLPVNDDGPTYALSFGDTVGCGLHADFLNGWKKEVLQAAMDECHDFNGDMDVSTCAPLSKYYDRDAEAACKFQSEVPNENIGLTGLIDKLVYCDPKESAETCTKQNADIEFVSETTTIDVLGIPLPIPIAVLHPHASSDQPKSSPTPKPDHSSSKPKTSPTSTQRFVTSSRPRPTSRTQSAPSSSVLLSADGPRPTIGGVGSPSPGQPGPIHRPPPGGEFGGGDDDDDC